MNIFRRGMILLVGVMAMLMAAPVCASEIKDVMLETSDVVRVLRAATPGTSDNAIKISDISMISRDGYNWFVIKTVNATSVTVDGYGATKTGTNQFEYKITQEKRYYFVPYANGKHGETYSKDGYVYNNLKLELDKKVSNGDTYLTIKVKGYGKVDTIKVDGDRIYLNSDNTKDVKVTESKRYYVELVDSAGHIIKDDINIDIDDDAPTVKLSKKLISGKWYLIIKVSPNSNHKISTVKVNGSSISCDKKGEELEYEASTGRNKYKVVARDDKGLETTKELTIDTNVYSQAPVVNLSTTQIGTQTYLTISVSDDGKISSLTVNGAMQTISANGGTINVPVYATGNYTVIAKDDAGLETNRVLYVVAGNKVTPTVTPTYPSSSGGVHTIIFKLNSKSYTLDGKTQTMDASAVAKGGRTYIPLRALSNALGIPDSNIQWDGKNKTVIIKDGSNVIKVPLNKKVMTLNGQSIQMDAATMSMGGRTMLPISQVAKAFSSRNVKLDWKSATKQVVITRS